MSEAGNGARQRCEERRPVASDDGGAMNAACASSLNRHAAATYSIRKFGDAPEYRRGVGAKIARGETANKVGGFRQIRLGDPGGRSAMRSVSSSVQQLLMRDAVGLPQLFQTPGSHGGGIDRGDVGVGQKRQELQPFQRADALGQQRAVAGS